MNPIKEPRVHGVSGTPPRDMLHTDPIPRLDGDPFARVYRRRPSLDAPHPKGRPYQTEAFHWGSLTTGHWLTSLWVLLAPFALANVAGWMALRRGRFHRTSIRLAGLGLTALFVAQMGYVIVGVPFQAVTDRGWGDIASTLLRAGIALAWLLMFGAIVLRLSTQSHFDPLKYRERFRLLFWPTVAAMRPDRHPAWDRFDDPGASVVGDAAMWSPHSILHRLRRIHFAAGLLVVALILARAIDTPLVEAGALAGLSLVLILISATAYAPTNRVVLATTAWLPLLAEAMALMAVVLFGLDGGGADINSLHRTTFHIAIAVGIAAAPSLLAGIPGVGALTIATFIGGAFGVGAGLVAEDLLSVSSALETQGGAWVAPASLLFVLFVALLGLSLTFRSPPTMTEEGFLNRILTRLTGRSRELLAGGAAFGLATGTFAIFEGCILTPGACDPSALTGFGGADFAVIVLLTTILVLAAVRLYPARKGLASILLIAGALVSWVGLFRPTVGRFDPAVYLEALPLARTLIFVAPVFAILRSILGAYRQGASSRKVGVIWDVVSFWPRWFHPLGPPAYGPKVVSELRDLVAPGDIEILAGHSQGSVIAAVATQRVVAEGGRVSGLITYGSPIGHLYGPLFPDVGISELVEDLPASLPSGWLNLWRIDDPIGARPLGGAVRSIRDETGSGHSGYELTRTYRDARDATIDVV